MRIEMEFVNAFNQMRATICHMICDGMSHHKDTNCN